MNGSIEVRARLEPRYERMRAAGANFTLVEPQISLQGVTGLQTLITGVVIECTPGSGDLLTQFSGKVPASPEEIKIESSSGLQIKLRSTGTHITAGAPVMYRDLQVGEVLSKDLSGNGATVELVVGIEERYAPLIRQNTVFWSERALHGSIGFLSLNLESAVPLGTGGVVKFATPDASAPRAKAMASFTLNAKPRREWLKWDPAIRLNP
jgi:paraquat-inducible protein B